MLKSKLKRIYDFASFVVPEELAIRPEKIERSVEDAVSFLSKKHAAFVESDGPVAAGDVVTVNIEKGGEPLPDPIQVTVGIGFNKAVEESVLGLKKAETGTMNLNGVPTPFEIARIRRRELPEITDAFIEGLNLENVHTISDYKAKLRDEFSEQSKNQNVYKIAQAWIKEGIEKSEFDISDEDVESKVESVKRMAAGENKSYEDYVRNYASLDLENPTAEESEAYMRGSLIRGIKEAVLGESFASGDGGGFDRTSYANETKELAARQNLSVEQIEASYSFEDYLQQAYKIYYYNHILDMCKDRIGLSGNKPGGDDDE